MFVCYQTSIADQFEFIVRNWINSADFARKAVGEDPFMGQTGGDRKRRFAGAVPAYPRGSDGDPIELRTDFVVPTGGGYFFAPSITTLVETFAKGLGTDEPARKGAWGPTMQTPNVPVHTHLLPDGNVLFWGRRENAEGSMDQHVCTPQIWDRNTEPPTFRPTPQPKAADGSTLNLFCSGHTFLPDGRLFVAGGHIQDSRGLDQVCVYDWRFGTWTPLPPMTHGRWYPSATTLTDGAVLVTSGSYGSGNQTPNNSVPQVWDGRTWTDLADKVVSLYPRMIVLEDGRVFVAGTDPDAFMLDALHAGTWSPAPARANGDRQYAPAVMYAPNKIIFIGGGNDPGDQRPTNKTEVIDFNERAPVWKPAAPMLFPRRQHNATLLPDGTILVTGGTRGPGFNDLSPSGPVHAAELWDPNTNEWTELATEDEDRCYHSTALLLPDATVLSAGGGEYFAHDNTIDPIDVHKDGQIFRPPYLFRGARPVIRSGPDGADYGSTFILTLDGAVQATRVTALRLGSVTHSMDTNQRLVELTLTTAGATLTITAPVSANACPPGYYMVFALSKLGVPSDAHIMRFGRDAGPRDRQAAAMHAEAARTTREAERVSAPKGTYVRVGLTSRCPYGLAACWAGAKQSLAKLDGVSLVEQQADAETSTAGLWLIGTGLPALARWIPQFKDSANGSYDIRGFEVSVAGALRRRGTALELTVDGQAVRLEHLGESEKVQWDWDRKAREPVAPAEADAFKRLLVASKPSGATQVMVTGPLRLEQGTPIISVREFSAPSPKPKASKRPASAAKRRKRS
jgi:hypothetical protein